MSWNRISPEHVITPRGLEAVWFHDPAATSFAVQFIVWTGSFNDPSGLEGLAHFAEHMPFKGTERYPTTADLTGAINGLGGFLNAYTNRVRTTYLAHVPAHDALRAVDVVTELVFRPRLRESDLLAEREIVKAEIANARQRQPAEVILEINERVLGATLGQKANVLGTDSSLDAISPIVLDVYRQRYYHPARMTFVVGGNLDALGTSWPEWLDITIPTTDKQSWLRPKLYAKPSGLPHHWDSRIRPVASYEVHLMGLLGRLDHDDVANNAGAHHLIRTIVWDSGMDSVLFKTLRTTHGLIYNLNGHMIESDRSLGTWELMTTCRTAADARRTVELIKETLNDPATWSTENVERAQEMMVGKAALRAWNGLSYADWMAGDMASYRATESEAQWLQRIRRTEPWQVKAAAAKMFDPGRMMTTIHHPQ